MVKIFKYFKESWLQVIAIVILLVVQAFCDLRLPQYTADIVDKGIAEGLLSGDTKGALSFITNTGLRMLGVTLILVGVMVAIGFLSARVGAGTARRLRERIYTKVISFSEAEIDRFSTASLITRTTNDIQQVCGFMVMFLRMMLYAPIIGVGGIIKVYGTHTGMGWIIGLAVAIVTVLIIIMLIFVMPKFKIMQTLIDKLNLVSREILKGVPVIRAFSRERYEEKRFDAANTNLMKTQRFANRMMNSLMPVMNLAMNGISVLIIWVAASRIDLGQMQVGTMITFMTYTMQIVMSFMMIAMAGIMLPRAAVAANRIEEVLGTKPSIEDPVKSRIDETCAVRGEVTFDRVRFRYPEAEADALYDVSFTARPGQTTAIIGSTGCGKSTVVKLIPRFYDVSQGTIRLDGVDIREMSQEHLRSCIGYVPQQGVLFSGTIDSNIRYSKRMDGLDITEDEMREAAAIAQATEFIEDKPVQYGEAIAQGGTNVSGGQKQRLSIARAVARHPKIFLFDDSFSALDFKTDLALRKALNEKLADATVIIVAQRINTILHADQIIVLDEGRVVGCGTHEELLSTCDEYREIAKSQLTEAELAIGGAA